MSYTEDSENSSSTWIITAACAVLLCVHVALRFYNKKLADGLDVVALGLAIVALSPWIATIFKSLKFGGMEVQFQQVKSKVAAQGLEIEQLKFLIMNFLPKWELAHMTNLAAPEPFKVN